MTLPLPALRLLLSFLFVVFGDSSLSQPAVKSKPGLGRGACVPGRFPSSEGAQTERVALAKRTEPGYVLQPRLPSRGPWSAAWAAGRARGGGVAASHVSRNSGPDLARLIWVEGPGGQSSASQLELPGRRDCEAQQMGEESRHRSELPAALKATGSSARKPDQARRPAGTPQSNADPRARAPHALTSLLALLQQCHLAAVSCSSSIFSFGLFFSAQYSGEVLLNLKQLGL
ncbi:uncharacterized protein LOC118014799 [Mirounga leonina]|uniref:uncharacterized protein LOC118014799 n=1 Tax=Mirounga leonina TaxID=9715 RepID=UPI00156BEB5C|nr:uncharacterized protein LOC118014799 [Mirounga leonina]